MSLGADVGEEAEPAAVDAEQRHVAAGRQARGVQQRAVAADGDQQVGAVRQLGSGTSVTGQQPEVDPEAAGGPHVAAALEQVRGQARAWPRRPAGRRRARQGDGRVAPRRRVSMNDRPFSTRGVAAGQRTDVSRCAGFGAP